MRKIVVFITIVLVFSSCRNRQNLDEKQVITQVEFDVSELPGLFELNLETQEIVDKWINYKELESSIEALYQIKNNEELILLIENTVEKQNAMASGKYPEPFNTPQIKSRQKVFMTFVLKVKATLEYRKDPIPPTIEMIDAFNIMRRQFDVLMNSQIDTKNILND
ncbi:hypothetical protein [Eudoraea chungangensis]|uniref:hypothetical protein n=1 Tax=Eudoraea chungangensis TaxID=1481905 RepID=UPI0023EAFD16|nr:hypothetical protein [Eudoraea chungangensis]